MRTTHSSPHRNSLTVLFQSGMLGGRPRTPFGYRVQIVDNHAVHYKQDGTKAPVDRYYYDEDGKIPYQMYYPGVKGVWPLHRWRRLWSWIADRRSRRQPGEADRQLPADAERTGPLEWHLPPRHVSHCGHQ